MKRARSEGTDEDQQAERTKMCPCRSLRDDLLQHVAQRAPRQCLNRELYLLVGRHTIQGDQTLQQAGVTRDCHVRVLTRLLSTDCPGVFEVQELLRRLQRLLQDQPQEAAAPGHRQALLRDIDARLERVWSLGLKAVTSHSMVLQQLVQLISAVAHSPGASLDDVRQAAAWLKSLGEFAAGFLGACSSRDVFTHVPWGSAAMLLELWLLALAEHLQLCIYCSERMKKKESTAEDAGRPQAFDMLQYLLTWLAAPMRDTPGSSLAVGPDEDCSGQGCLVGLLEGTDWDSQLMPVALLLQGILLVTADYALCSYRAAFKKLPGLPPELTASLSPSGPADDAPLAQLPQALSTLGHAVLLLQPVLQPLLSGSRSLGRVAEVASLTAVGSCPAALHLTPTQLLDEEGLSRKQQLAAVLQQALQEDPVWHTPSGAAAAQMALKVAASAAYRADVQKQESFMLDEYRFPMHLQPLRPAWDFLPLLEGLLDALEAFASFATAAELPMAARDCSLRHYLPACLTEDAALLKLLEAWLLLDQLAQADASGRFSRKALPHQVERLGEVLNHPLVKAWLDVNMASLTPSKVAIKRSQPGSGKKGSSGLDPAGVAAALLDLLGWAPGLEQQLSTPIGAVWLQRLLYPEPPDDDDDDSGSEEVGEVRLEVRRQHLLQDSYEQVLSLEPRQLRRRLSVVFVGEDAYGNGVLKEWLVQLAAALFAPAAGLFLQGACDRALVHPCPAAALQPDWPRYSTLAGRVVGLALRHRVPLGIALSSSFFAAAAGAATGPPAAVLNIEHSMEGYNAEVMRQRLQQMPDWRLPHPWQAVAAAAAKTTQRRSNSSSSSSNKQQHLEVNMHAWECCSAGDGDGDDARDVSKVLVRDMAGEPDFVAALVARRWRQQPSIDDLQQIDPEMVPGLQALLDDPTMADTLGLTFTAAAAAAAAGTASAGGAGEVELVPGGSQLGVEPGCVQQYVAALLDRKLLGGCSLQVLWFFAGLADVAEPAAAALSRGRLLLPLTASCFNSALRGSAAPLSVTEWRAAATVCSSLLGNWRYQDMFWAVVAGLNEDQRRKLLRFWTGISHLPADGFSGLGRKLQLMAAAPPAAAAGEDSAAAAADSRELHAVDSDAAGSDDEDVPEQEEIFNGSAGGDGQAAVHSGGHGAGARAVRWHAALLNLLGGMLRGLEILVRNRSEGVGHVLHTMNGVLRQLLAAAPQQQQAPGAAESAAVGGQLDGLLGRLQQLRQCAAAHPDAAVADDVEELAAVLQQMVQQVSGGAWPDGPFATMQQQSERLSEVWRQLRGILEEEAQVMQMREALTGPSTDGQQQQQQQEQNAAAAEPLAAPAVATAAAQLAEEAPQAAAGAAAAAMSEAAVSEQRSDVAADSVMTDVEQQAREGLQEAAAAAAAPAAAQEATGMILEAPTAAASEVLQTATTSRVHAALAASTSSAAAACPGEEAASSDKATEDVPAGAAAAAATAAAAAAPAAAAVAAEEQDHHVQQQQQQQQMTDVPTYEDMHRQLLSDLAAEGAESAPAVAAAVRLQPGMQQQGLPGPLPSVHEIAQLMMPAVRDDSIADNRVELQAGDAAAANAATAAVAAPPLLPPHAVAAAAEAVADTAAAPAPAAAGAVQTAAVEQPAADAAGAEVPAADVVKVLQLPRAHTCFMQLLLPTSYSDAGEMRQALLLALENVDYFGLS